MARLLFLALGLLWAALTLGGGAAQAGGSPTRSAPPPVHVEVSDFLFEPTPLAVDSGQTVVFDFVGPSRRTVTDASGMAFYGSGSAGPGDPSFSVTYPAAGGYLFTCIPHPWMVGRVTIPMRVHRLSGPPTPSFRVSWAASDATSGFVYDVQITRPGRGWADWRSGATIRVTSFSPTAGTGTYRFRARMRSLAGGHALWSPPVTFHVG